MFFNCSFIVCTMCNQCCYCCIMCTMCNVVMMCNVVAMCNVVKSVAHAIIDDMIKYHQTKMNNKKCKEKKTTALETISLTTQLVSKIWRQKRRRNRSIYLVGKNF